MGWRTGLSAAVDDPCRLPLAAWEGLAQRGPSPLGGSQRGGELLGLGGTGLIGASPTPVCPPPCPLSSPRSGSPSAAAWWRRRPRARPALGQSARGCPPSGRGGGGSPRCGVRRGLRARVAALDPPLARQRRRPCPDPVAEPPQWAVLLAAAGLGLAAGAVLAFARPSSCVATSRTPGAGSRRTCWRGRSACPGLPRHRPHGPRAAPVARDPARGGDPAGEGHGGRDQRLIPGPPAHP